MKLLQCTASGEQHGLINSMTNLVPFDEFKNMKPEHKKFLEAEKKEDARVVKVEYLNSMGKNERLTKPYCKYSGDPIQIWHFIPGKIYEVPLGLVKEVNDSQKQRVRRAGLLEVAGKEAQNSGAPLDKDEEGPWLHKFVASGF